MLTHLPYQPWSSACVEGRERDDPHRRRPHRDADAFSVISFDLVVTKVEPSVLWRGHSDVCSHDASGTTTPLRCRRRDLFVMALGHASTVLLADGEPATREMTASFRQKLITTVCAR